jgi:uncharacterized membrane protein
MLVLGVAFILLKWLMTRSWDRHLAAGFIGVVLACALQYFIAYSSWWYRVAGWVTA